MIVLENVTKRYGRSDVLKSVSLAIHPKEFVCITGPSGAGKSTLIHMLIGAETASSGVINVDGVDLRKVPNHALQLYRRRVGIVFQDYKLLWNRTVEENIAFPLEICGAKDSIIKARVTEVIEQTRLQEQAKTLCSALSGGEKARTAIARSIVHKPMIVFADEPTGNLDPHESIEVLKLFKSIHKGGTTIVLATHDLLLVDALKTRVVRIEKGEITRDSVGKYLEKTKPKEEKDSSVISSGDEKKDESQATENPEQTPPPDETTGGESIAITQTPV